MVLLLTVLQSVERELYGMGQCNEIQTWHLNERNVKPIDYDLLRENPNANDQIQSIIREASSWPCLPYGHSFRIGFDPHHEDIVLNEDILTPFKENNRTIWIYIEHQYKNLKASPVGISVVVFFNGKPEQILIPYESITGFDDPAYNFFIEPREKVGTN